VDDGSTDNTPEILSVFNQSITVLKHRTNRGYGASLKTGIKNATTEFIAFYDADGQHRPEDLVAMAKETDDYDMVVGSRTKESHQEWVRKPGKWLLSKVANYLTGEKIPDLNSGLRLIRRSKIINLLHLFPDGFSFSTTSTIAFFHLKYEVKYFPIKTNKRVGKSTVKQIKHGSSVILLILRLIVLFNPLKVFIPTSIWLIIIGSIYEVIYGIIIMYPDVKLIPAAFFMFITGILIFFFGLIADQISALRLHNTISGS
jgi:glycosyltransferase involved in cell wall biosynthesis